MSASKRREIPHFGLPIIETHCHLDYLAPEDLSHALAYARSVGVERIITIAVSPDNLDTVIALTAEQDNLWCTQGIHPHEAAKYSDSVHASIAANSDNAAVVAIGEIGLDYHYDHADRAVQRDVFARQLALASSLDLPVVVHTRDADEDTQSILQEHLPHLRRRGVIHSFSSSLALAEFCLDAGFMLGFNGMVTFRNADNVREAVAATPLTQLVLETDAPYLTPVPYRGRQNAPCFLPFIAEKIAEVKTVSIETILTAAYSNSERLFFHDQRDAKA